MGSVIQGKQEIKDYINSQKDIRTILDIGANDATYPKLLGDDYKYIGVEIWGPYIEQFEEEKYYKEIIISDVYYLNWEKVEADCVIFGDVIEHMTKDKGYEVIEDAIDHISHIIISIPIGKNVFGKVHNGNKFERHLSEWNYDDLYNICGESWKVAKLIKKNNIGIFCK